MALKLSCIAFTEPLDAAVVVVAQSAEAKLPKFCGRTLVMRATEEPLKVNDAAPGYGRKAVLYATCFVNFNNTDIGAAARAVLAMPCCASYPSPSKRPWVRS